ncbi:MAG: ABC transporter ATP-binding protein, partial [Dehalococcoidia bacterium]|nr:ABC transporter ATP-binding protein [Dehalococcoidia bacterium]
SRIQNDVSQIQDSLSQGFLTFGDVTMLLGIVAFMLALDVKLAMLTFVAIPLLAVTMIVWQGHARRAFMRARRSISVVNAKLQENISGVRAIQSMNREKVNMEQFDKLNNANLQANLRATRLSSALMPVVEVLSALSISIVIMYGGYLALNGQITIGLLLSFALYAQRFFDPIRNITQEYASFQRSMVAGHRIFQVLDTKPDVQDSPNAVELPAVKGEIVFKDVNFHYNKEVPILKDFNLHIKPGETIALVGPTGAGKSTVASLVSRFYDVSSGSIMIDGHDLRDIKRSSIAKQIAMVLQDPFLFTGTIRENIRYGRLEATNTEVEKAATLVGLEPFLLKMENGLDTPIFERGVNLSVGQRQLISFARAVLADPHILILDEATANIDTQTEMVIQQALKTLLKGRTSIVIAHRLSTIKDADGVIVIEGGRITEQGTHMDLLRASGTYERLYTMSYQLA